MPMLNSYRYICIFLLTGAWANMLRVSRSTKSAREACKGVTWSFTNNYAALKNLVVAFIL